ncbi:MAG: 30S ribosomal protein S2 [bacterium]|nr:30S ribosomal protein S2 [bacterium]MCK6561071.1 30S ribosomal protein S2 [bacterium]NUM64838.1 30S ribosomal protein S2 [candidate division KSB1 bacterium]
MNVTLQDLLVAGTHFGHLTRRWNPKMRKYIFMERNGIHIIDLKKSLESLQLGMQSLGQIVRGGDKVLFVGTKKQAKDVIKDAAERCNMYYVTERWLGGMLTNFSTIKKSIKRLKNIEKMSTDGTYDKITKKEILSLEREREKLEKVLGGIREMTRLPGALFVVDVRKEAIAVAEANKLGIPVAAIVDTNCDPSPIAYPIPGNDDAFKSISLISRAISDAVLEAQSGLQKEMISAEEESDEETFKKRMDEREFAEEEGVEA